MLLTALDPSQQLRTLRLDGITPDAALADHAIVLTDAIADDLDVAIGDPVTVATPAGAASCGSAPPATNPSPPAPTSHSPPPPPSPEPTPCRSTGSTYESTSHPPAPSAPSSSTCPAPCRSSSAKNNATTSSHLAIITAIIAIMLTFAVAMAFAPVFNAMTINVLEREREYATMRSLGARPASIGRLLATEGAVLWLLALAPGLILGTWVVGRSRRRCRRWPLRPTRAHHPLATRHRPRALALTLIALALPLRRVANLDLASSTKTLA